MTLKTALIMVLLIYGIPLWRMRYRWRSTIYRTSAWKINVMPWFARDVAALFSNRYFVNASERRMARKYRGYVAVYLMLWVWVICLS